ncbi:hypothetical protein IM53_009975 [Xanthomonas phaseoli pv. dieffenbachiae]|uniref:Uncharacterized protein n=1 Tax=Xanthomonas phaseoli pv. dieffenbachiae TaxID=92828 RepID=A0A1V9H9J9_9XANT|nr:hypothetical protein IM53_009975 [Xanthomonas phaseoli pv. dieffenbachiae]
MESLLIRFERISPIQTLEHRFLDLSSVVQLRLRVHCRIRYGKISQLACLITFHSMSTLLFLLAPAPMTAPLDFNQH